MPTSTVEDYLKQILLAQQRAPERLVSTGEVATKLHVAPGTATAMIKTLADSGLVDHEPYSGVRLTEQGRQLALHVLRRHRLVELFLVQVMGMDWSEVHAEAEQLEHVISDRLLERMDELLDHPQVDPHGDPIPDASGAVAEPLLPNLLTCPLDEPLRVARVSDQDSAFLRFLESNGLTLGSPLRVRAREPAVETVTVELTKVPLVGDVAAAVDTLNLAFVAASKILVRQEAAPTAPTEAGSTQQRPQPEP